MKVYAVFSYCSPQFDNDNDVLRKIFLSKESAEKYILINCLHEIISKVEMETDGIPNTTFYYLGEQCVYRIEEHVVLS